MERAYSKSVVTLRLITSFTGREARLVFPFPKVGTDLKSVLNCDLAPKLVYPIHKPHRVVAN